MRSVHNASIIQKTSGSIEQLRWLAKQPDVRLRALSELVSSFGPKRPGAIGGSAFQLRIVSPTRNVYRVPQVIRLNLRPRGTTHYRSGGCWGILKRNWISSTPETPIANCYLGCIRLDWTPAGRDGSLSLASGWLIPTQNDRHA